MVAGSQRTISDAIFKFPSVAVALANTNVYCTSPDIILTRAHPRIWCLARLVSHNVLVQIGSHTNGRVVDAAVYSHRSYHVRMRKIISPAFSPGQMQSHYPPFRREGPHGPLIEPKLIANDAVAARTDLHGSPAEQS